MAARSRNSPNNAKNGQKRHATFIRVRSNISARRKCATFRPKHWSTNNKENKSKLPYGLQRKGLTASSQAPSFLLFAKPQPVKSVSKNIATLHPRTHKLHNMFAQLHQSLNPRPSTIDHYRQCPPLCRRASSDIAYYSMLMQLRSIAKNLKHSYIFLCVAAPPTI